MTLLRSAPTPDARYLPVLRSPLRAAGPWLRARRRAVPVTLKLLLPVTLLVAAIAGVYDVAATAYMREQLDTAYATAAHGVAFAAQAEYVHDEGRADELTSFARELVASDRAVFRVRFYRVVDGQAMVWASSQPSDVGTYHPDPHDIAPLETGQMTQSEEPFDGAGEMVRETIHPIYRDGRIDAAVGIYTSLHAQDAAIAETRRRIGLIAAIGGGALVGLLALIAEFVVLRRLRRMRRAAEAVAAGDLSVRLPEGDEPPARDELVTVARQFDHMVRAVAAREEELRVLYQRAADEAATMTRRALHDPLTDLPNRLLLQDRLEQAIAAGKRHDGTPVAVLMIDLDGFKGVNDAHGHQAGDDLLRAVAGALVSAVRETDTVARVGGDEFAIVLPGADAAAATTVAIKVQQHIAALARTDRRFAVGASVGSAAFPADGTEPAGLLAIADARMYAAKVRRTGRRPVRSVAVAL